MTRIAKFRCVKCRFEWSQDRPSCRSYTTDEAAKMNHPCPRCGHLYVKWLNYDEVFAHARGRAA